MNSLMKTRRNLGAHWTEEGELFPCAISLQTKPAFWKGQPRRGQSWRLLGLLCLMVFCSVPNREAQSAWLGVYQSVTSVLEPSRYHLPVSGPRH